MSVSASRNYLTDLAARTTRGLQNLPESFRAKQSHYLLGAQQSDGGFRGRGGGSDLYYTSFALRSAELLGIADHNLWRHAAYWLRARVEPLQGVVNCFSMLHSIRLIAFRTAESAPEIDCACTARAEPVLERCIAPEGGVAGIPGDAAGVYHTFLAALCYQLLGRPMPDAARATAFVLACRCEDGGFIDSCGAAVEAGANPTAAGVALLSMHDALNHAAAESAVEFIRSMQREDGGFAAHRNAPVADLMSTFTALVTLAELGGLRRARLAPVARYVQQLAAPEGGFRGAAVADAIDPEYTYYGLGALGMLSSEAVGAGARPPQGVDLQQIQEQEMQTS